MLSCELHDYIEIACLYHFEVKLELRNNENIQGIAETTGTSVDKREWIVLKIDDLNQKLDLTDIASMQAITANQHFDKVNF